MVERVLKVSKVADEGMSSDAVGHSKYLISPNIR